MPDTVVGIVIGSRKCGTTWLYENFLEDPDLCVSLKVKESGFFASANDSDAASYERLYPKDLANRVEVDTSLVYSDISAEKINNYNPDMKIALILRDPIEYAASRYIQTVRKGQISSDDISQAVAADDLLTNELDYASMLSRYDVFKEKGNLLVVPYSLLTKNPVEFYLLIKRHLTGKAGSNYEPNLDRINVARVSRCRAVTSFLSHAARVARKHKFHFAVNWTKSLNIHKVFERTSDDADIRHLKDRVSKTVLTNYSQSVKIYNEIEKQYLNDELHTVTGL